MTTTFAELGVPSFICDALARRDIHQPFAIQSATIADGLAGRDVCGRAPTGSGKTLAFGVPLIASVADLGRAVPGSPHALVLAPTRELADQITAELGSFSGRVRVDAVYGGVGYGSQLNALRRGVDVLVACPGRLEDLIQRRDVDLGRVRFVVLDEADRMADMGFMPAVRRLLDRTASDRQTVLFSATLDGDVAKLTAEYQRDAVRHEVGSETPDVRSAVHKFWLADREQRNEIVAGVVHREWPSVVFVRTRHGADRLAKQLAKLGVDAVPIHGNRSQSQRTKALEAFSSGKAQALIATDVAARGIHVDGVASVVHYDLPEDHKAYVHRSGRTARAGASGLVVSLVQPEQRRDYTKIQREIGLDEPFTKPDVEVAQVTSTTTPAATPSAPRSNGSRSGTPATKPHGGHGGHGGTAARDGAKNGNRNRNRSRDRNGNRSGNAGQGDGRTQGRPEGGRQGSKQANRKARRAHLQPSAPTAGR